MSYFTNFFQAAAKCPYLSSIIATSFAGIFANSRKVIFQLTETSQLTIYVTRLRGEAQIFCVQIA